MQKTNLVLLIIGGLVLLGAGYSLGVSLGQKGVEQTETALSDLVGSKVIGKLTTTASGEITEISGRNLTLVNEEESLTVLIKEDATFYRSLQPEEAETPQLVEMEETSFEEIKVGSQINIACELKADSSLEGIDVTILLK